ncbi:MAG TPA: DUF1015 domain-containing protein [bacterium]
MPEIRPFNGIRYNNEKIKKIADVITQPYDQITDEMEKDYKKRSPYSFVNLVLTHYADGHDRPREYEEAKKSVEDWILKKIFTQDAQPAIYPYFQKFTVDQKPYIRKGFFCTVRLEELGKGGILPHEKTLSKPKEDRMSLTRITKKDFEPVFMLYTDTGNSVMTMLEKECSRPPLIDVADDNSVNHQLWQISNPALIRSIAERMRSSTFVIADGHHRYETFYSYSQELKGIGTDHPARFKMMVLVNIQDPGLVILPTHRLITNLPAFEAEKFKKQAQEYFLVKKTGRENIGRELAAEKSQAYGFYSPGVAFIVKLRSPEVMAELLKDKSRDFQQLDVAILHTLLIEKILGIRSEKIEDHIRYQRGIEETIRRVDSSEFQFCFLMNPTQPEQVKEVAQHHERMPQKSTDFFPKLISGLVFYDIA